MTLVALAGCGSDVDVELVWGGPPDAAPGGAVSADGFAGFQNEVDEEWETFTGQLGSGELKYEVVDRAHLFKCFSHCCPLLPNVDPG